MSEEENYSPVAQSRANYYTPGSPVQFVRVELLRGDQSGENAVCLSFRNISSSTLTGLTVKFRCKNAQGETICEDSFTYDDINAAQGEVFGMDDAVFVTADQIGSVDVVLQQVKAGRKSMSLASLQRVRLPQPRRLPKDMAAALRAQLGRDSIKYMPQVLEQGWYCACGAFHPNEENTVYCSECGSDRILLQDAVNKMLHPEAPAAEAEEFETPVAPAAAAAPAAEPTRVAANAPAAAEEPAGGTRILTKEERETVRPAKAPEKAVRITEEEDDEGAADSEEDALADKIIRWAPPVTALACGAVVLIGFLICHFAA